VRQREKDRVVAKKLKEAPESGKDVNTAAVARMTDAREGKHTYTRAETEAQLAMLRVLIGSRASWGPLERLIEMRKHFPTVGKGRIAKLTERIEQEYRARVSVPERLKVEFITRCRIQIDICTRKGNHSAAAKYEEMLANCEGTLIAPSLNINNFNVAPALVGVMGDLPADQVAEMLAEQQALEADAGAYRALPMPTTEARASVGRTTVEERVPVTYKPRGRR
jgi:hypothetical protein